MIRSFEGTSPTIADSAYVDESAVVIGDVTLEEDTSVWPGAVLRGDTQPITLAEGANVQDNATIHNGGTIGPESTVGHNAIVHNATVGTASLIGMGSIILDDATVEDRCVVAANSLVTKGSTVPEMTLVAGSPAEAVREYDQPPWPDASEWYVEMAKRYTNTSRILTRETVQRSD
jgi:carbonic anhydrase/acetyltransferase-like protein (isoleucine patch superfamily)